MTSIKDFVNESICDRLKTAIMPHLTNNITIIACINDYNEYVHFKFRNDNYTYNYTISLIDYDKLIQDIIHEINSAFLYAKWFIDTINKHLNTKFTIEYSLNDINISFKYNDIDYYYEIPSNCIITISNLDIEINFNKKEKLIEIIKTHFPEIYKD